MEIKKLFIYKKILSGIIGLIIVNVMLFSYFNLNEKKYEADSTEYAQEYKESINTIISSAKKMTQISVFAKDNSFSKRNIIKTSDDYKKFENRNITSFNNSYLKAFFEYKGTNIVLLIIGILLVLVYKQDSDEIKQLIFATKEGRAKLQIKKVIAIFFTELVCVLVCNLSILIVSQIIYKGNLLSDISVTIQSISLFKASTLDMSLGTFLLVFAGYKTLVIFACSMIVWVVYALTRKESIALCVIIGLIIMQYFFAGVKYSNPVINILKYCNFYYLFYGNGFFTEYKNINISNKAINKNTLSLIFIIGTGIVFLVSGICYGAFAKGKKRSSVIEIINSFFTKIKNFVQVHFSEGYKLLICEKVFLIIIVVVFVSIKQMDFRKISFTSDEEKYFEFIDKYEGAPSEESQKEIDGLRQELKEVDKRFISVEEDYVAGKVDLDHYMEAQMWYANYDSDRKLLKKIEAQTGYLESLNIKGWYVNYYKYNKLFNKNDVLLNLVLFISIVLICSGIFYYERKNNICFLIRATKGGRNTFFNKKMGSALCIAIILGVFEIGLELIANYKIYGGINVMAPIQSLELFSFVKIKCRIWQFLFICYLLRLILVVAVAMIASSISIIAEPGFAAIGTFLLCVPTFLYMLGIKPMKRFSLIDFMQISNKIIALKSIGLVAAFCFVIFMLAIVLQKIGKKKWCD